MAVGLNVIRGELLYMIVISAALSFCAEFCVEVLSIVVLEPLMSFSLRLASFFRRHPSRRGPAVFVGPCLFIRMCVYITPMHVSMCAPMCLSLSIYIYLNIDIYTDKYTHKTCVYAHVYACVHVYMN